MTNPTNPRLDEQAAGQQLPTWALAAMLVVGLLLMLGFTVGPAGTVGALTVILSDGLLGLLVLLSAGGYGYLVLRRFLPAGAPTLLALATAAGLGLWLYSTAMLIVGSTLGGLEMWVWWPVVIAGAGLALWQAHKPLGKLALPRRVSSGSLVWVLAALAAGIWLAGASLPPGWCGSLTADSYDILEYHLQVPREYLLAGKVWPLSHNVYSHYPLGAEMLFLLAMCLRGGAYEGMYLAQIMHGLFGIVMVAAVYGGLRRRANQDQSDAALDDFRARSAAALLFTAPWVLYLSWLAMSELAEMCYLALALLWLRQYFLVAPGVSRGSASPPADAGGYIAAPPADAGGYKVSPLIGLSLGAACAMKYLSVGLIAAPVLAVLLVASIKKRRPADFLIALVFTGVMFSPWLIRNTVTTGNPVFPLANTIFGRDGWSGQQAERWNAAHGPEHHTPVPIPADYKPPTDQPSRLDRLAGWFLGLRPYESYPVLGAATVILLACGVLAMLLRPRGVAGWDWAVLAVLAMQLIVWAAATHEMPARFASVCIVPIALLASLALARLAGIRQIRWLKQPAPAGVRWGLAPATLLLIATAVLNFGSIRRYFEYEIGENVKKGWQVMPVGFTGQELSEQVYFPPPPGQENFTGRLMLVGNAAAFYYPPGTVYATVFDKQPLEDLLVGAMNGDSGAPITDETRAKVSAGLRQMGITHVQIVWAEIRRLEYTYGWPAGLSRQHLSGLTAAWPIVRQYPPPTATDTCMPAAPVVTLFAVP